MRIFIIVMILGGIAYAPIYWAAVPSIRRYIGVPFVLSFVTLIFAGMFAPTTIFYLMCPLVMLTMTQDRLDAVCRFLMLGGLIPNISVPLVIGDHNLLKVSTTGALAVGLALAMYKPQGTKAPKIRGFTSEDAVVLLLFAALNLASVRFSDGFNGLVRQGLSGTIELLIPYFLLRHNIRSVREYRVTMTCTAIVCAILGVYALYEAGHGWSLFISINENLGEQEVGIRNGLIRGNSLRASTTMQGPLMLGCYCSVGWIAMVCSRPMVRNQLAWIGGLGLVSLGMLAAQSRGSTACVALAVIVLLVAYRKPGIAVAAMAALAGGFSLLLGAAKFSPAVAGFLNLNADTTTSGGELDYRQLLLRRGMEEAAKHRWTGTDLTSILVQLQDIKQGEGIVDFVNTYLFVYLVNGLLGLVPLILAMAWMFQQLVGSFRRSDNAEVVAVRGFILCALIAVLVQLAFMSFIDRMPVLFALTLVGSRLFVLARRSAMRRPAAPPKPRPRRAGAPEVIVEAPLV